MRTPVAFLVALLYFVSTARAADLAFITPNITALETDSRGWHYYLQGDGVTIAWTTPFDQTTLIVFESQDNGTWNFQVLGVDFSPSETTFQWQAQTINNDGFGNKMYFAIENSNDIGCTGCVEKTPGFYVTNKRPAGGSYSSSTATASRTSATSSTPTSGSMITTARTSAKPTTANGSGQTATNSQGSAIAGAAASSSPTHSHKSSHSTAIGLGVGLGIGLAALFALIALLLICLRRRRRRNRDSFNYRPTGSGNWTQDDTPPNAEKFDAPEPKSMASINRESGVLGAAAVTDLASPSRHSNLSHVSNPFRPSTNASRLSHSSWIEPFEFEKPGAKENDAMSQLRQSTLADSAMQSDSTPHGDSASSHYSDGPEVFGPESPSDAAVVASPSSQYGPFTRASIDTTGRMSAVNNYTHLADIPEKPQPAYTADGRNWPLS